MIASSTYLPKTIALYLTHHCVATCPHCFLTQRGLLNKGALPLEHAKAIVNDAYKHNVYMIILAGGEPLLYPHFFELLSYIRKKKMLPLIGISGLLLTKKHVDKFITNGISSIQVSLDGANPKTNDSIRGLGSFSKITSAIKMLQSAQIKVNIAFCIHEKNIHELEDMTYLAEKLNAFRIKVAYWKSSGVPTSRFKEISRDQKEIIEKQISVLNEKQGRKFAVVDKNQQEEHKSYYSDPPVIVLASGRAYLGEFGIMIGTTKNQNLSELYASAIVKKRTEYLEQLIKVLQKKYKIKSIEQANTSVIKGAALTFRYGNSINILVNSSLPKELRYLTVLHEMGHIARRSLIINPREEINKKEEAAVNKWAIARMKACFRPETIMRFNNLAKNNEDLLFQEFRHELVKP